VATLTATNSISNASQKIVIVVQNPVAGINVSTNSPQPLYQTGFATAFLYIALDQRTSLRTPSGLQKQLIVEGATCASVTMPVLLQSLCG